jgi:hypothetical protein
MAEVKCVQCEKVCASLAGWKSHMSRAHGGWDESDLQAVLGGNSGSEESVKERMNAFADSLPGAGGVSDTSGPASETGTPSVTPAPIPPIERRVRATPKKLKKVLGGIPAKLLEEAKVEIDAEDRDALDEAGEFLADIFGVEFSVPESKVVVESRWWAIAWVAGITGLIFVKHRFPDVFQYVFKLLKKKGPEDTIDKKD